MKKTKEYLKKKGFTLIELLAVIIILAIIALIAVPVIINTIENSKKKAFEDSVLITSRELDNYMIEHSDFNYGEGEEITVEQLKSVVKHKFTSGSFRIVNGELEAYFVTDGTYCAMGSIKNLEISKDCTSLDQTKPYIYIEYLNVESNGTSVIVTLKKGIAEDKESGIKEHRVSIYNGETKVDTETVKEIENQETVTFNDLDETTTYKIVLTVENGNGITNSVEVSLNKPTTQVSPEGWAQSKTVTIIYPTGYTNTYSVNGGSTWNTYENPIVITENNKTVHAKISNGSNYVTSASQTVSQIDTSAPTVANVTKKSTTSKSITVTASGSDEPSGIYGYQFSKDNGDTWTEVQRDNEYTFENLSSGTYNIKVKVINNTYPNNGINEDNSLVSSTNAISTDEIPTPTYTTSPSGWAQSKTVTIDYHDTNNTYNHEYSLNGGASWQTYSNPIVFNTNGTVLARITDGTNTVTGYISGSSYSVSGIDNSHPTDVTFTYTRTSNSITVIASGTDEESDIYGYQFSSDNGVNWTTIQTSNVYTFTGLTTGNYQIKLKAINGTYSNVGSINNNNSAESSSNEVETLTIDAPTYTIDKTGWQTKKTVTINYNDSDNKYVHEYSKDGETWTRTTGNTEEVEFTANGTVLARVTDGTNTVTGYISGSSYSVSGIDTVQPTASASIGDRTTTSVVVNATCTAGDSGIIKIEYSSDNGSNYINRGTSTSYTFTNLSQGTSYNFKVRCTNGVGTPVESSTTAGVTKATAVFNGNGGSDGTSKTLDVGAQLGTLPSSSRSYTITYNTNSQSATSSKTSETVTYTQNGWWTDATNGTQINVSTTMPSGGKTYYAHWTSNSTTLATIERTGYTCTWNTKSDGTGTSYTSGATNYTPTSTHTLYARCTVNNYTVIFDGNGGSNGTSITKAYGSQLGTLPTSTRTNYEFDGWYTDATGGTQITTSTTMPLNGATYYAHWNLAAFDLNSVIKKGDYVQMTPNPGTLDSQDRYPTDTTKTGYSSIQYLYPKELNLWRVIDINSDGTIEMISEYTSSVDIYFSGTNGYANLVGYLNVLASQYVNNKYTVGSRNIGFNNQTTYISPTSAFDGSNNNIPWSSSTTSVENQKPSNEPQGGGDTMYANDTNKVKSALGSLIAYSVSNHTQKRSYWLSSRYYTVSYGKYFGAGRYVDTSGNISYGGIRGYDPSDGSNFDSIRNSYLRPIITLNKNLKVTGSGTSTDPYVLQ